MEKILIFVIQYDNLIIHYYVAVSHYKWSLKLSEKISFRQFKDSTPLYNELF